VFQNLLLPLLLAAQVMTGPDKKLSSVPLAVPEGYSLVWSDEFDGTPLPNERKWAYDTEFNRRGWHNNELQYYSDARPKNARIEGGSLVIEAHQERLSREAGHSDWGGQDYTSARLITRGRGQWTYGYFEIRAKVPCATGTWPAIWLLPVDNGGDWEEGGEIDIMEHVGHELNRVHQSFHTAKLNFRLKTHPTVTSVVPRACSDFHVYQLNWTPDRLEFGIDGILTSSHQRTSNDRRDWPFNKPFYLLLNVAVGGNWGGAEGIDAKALPDRMEVDYVRVYQNRR